MSAGATTEIARINAPNAANAAVFGASLLPWPTVVAGALALVLRQPFDVRLWLLLTIGWGAVELSLRNPHQVTLECEPGEPEDAYSLVIRSWLGMLVRRPGVRLPLCPDSTLVRNLGIVRAPGEELVELRIYRWQFAALVHALERAGFEVHDESTRGQAGVWLRRFSVAVFLVAVVLALALVAAAALRG